MSDLDDAGIRRAHKERGAAPGPWTALVSSLSASVDREQVFASICDDGLTTGRYVMMSVLSAAIATLGLLLSSPAVVIGAMLLSPLMGPIILLGFSFWTVDWSAAQRALTSLIVGLGVSLAVAVILTWASPLKEPTAQILARTRPNLFDLMVAAFSGVAGGYAVIRQRGETVIGVAIATALMPPIATVGFGLGVANWTIAMGALLLFTTNLIAIALAAAAMAALYGFRPHYRFADRGWIGHAAVVSILIALCVPLTVSLNTIALESRATVSARNAIKDLFGKKARLTSLSVRSSDGGLEVDGLVATPKYLGTATTDIARRLKAALGVRAQVNLDQVILADPQQFAAAPSAPPPDPAALTARALRDAAPFPQTATGYDASNHQGLVLLSPASGLDLAAAQALEKGLRARDGLSETEVVPALQPLAPIPVAMSKGEPPRFGPELAVETWALQRWRSGHVVATLCGLSRRDRRRPAIADALVAALRPLSAGVSPPAPGDCRASLPGAYVTLRPASGAS